MGGTYARGHLRIPMVRKRPLQLEVMGRGAHRRWLAMAVVFGIWATPGMARAASPASFAYQLHEETASGAYDVSASVRASGDGEARLCFGYRGPKDHDYVRVTRRAVSLVRVSGGKERLLASPYTLSVPLGPEATPVLVKRRPEKVSVVFRGQLIQVAGDVSNAEGQVGIGATGAFRATDLRLQPVEPPSFSDDFMREPSEAGPWEILEGTWGTTTVGDTEKSANGFFYRGSGTPGLAISGIPFWDDYILQASVKCTKPDGAFGLGVYCQDAKNYLGLVWNVTNGLRLIRVVNGRTTVLATKPVAWVQGQWYRLALQVLDGHLTAMVDGKVCLEARESLFSQGKIALYVEGEEIYFDDIAVKPAVYFRDADPMARRERWSRVSGGYITGSPSWQDYTYRVRTLPTDLNGVGLIFGWRDPENYYLFRWGANAGTAPGAGRQQLIRVAEGKRVVIADARGGYEPNHAYVIETAFRPGYAAVRIDGQRVLETADPHLTHGAVGVTPFDSRVKEVTVTLREEPPPPEEEITKEFTDSAAHPDMAEWANPARAWVLRAGPKGPVFWRKGEYFGDVSVELTLPKHDPSQTLAFHLAARDRDPQSGYTIVARTPEPGKLVLQLLRQAGTEPVAAVTAGIAPGTTPTLTLSYIGSYLLADLDNRRILKYADPNPLRGSCVGLYVVGVSLDLRNVRVRSRNVYDYTFHDAPTDWEPQSGAWEVTSRWSCSPGWSWFGGWSEGLAAIWNKRRFEGDFVLEYYAAPKMDAVAEAYAQRFRDLNATICADGKRLSSGYSFLIGGWRNKRTAILRGDRVVAETRSYTLPPQKVGHRQWFYVRIEKIGNRISLSVDDKHLLSYEDPDPLTGDRVALWTQNNGIMLARVLVCYEKEKELPLVTRKPGKPETPATRLAAAASVPVTLPVFNDFETGVGQWRGVNARLATDATTPAAGKRCLAVTNPQPGGDFRVQAIPGRFDAMQAKTLAFDYRVPPGILVNLYVRIGRIYYVIGFTGQPSVNPAAGVLASLGKIEDVRADNAWHRAEFDLLGALRRFFPNANPLFVEELVFANWDSSDENMYADAGLTGNAMGARYYIDNFVLGDMPAAALPQATPAPKPAAAIGPKAPQPVRVATRSAPAIPEPRPESPTPAKPRVALLETFTGGKTTTTWDSMDGKWAVTRDGRFAPTEKPEFAFAFTGDREWRDYALKADLINGQDAGLLVRAQDWNNCVFLVIRPGKRDLWWFVRRNGQWGGVLAPMALPFGTKPLLKVKVLVTGDTYTCYLDGKKVSQIKDATFPKGRIGVYIHPAEPGQAWDNVEVVLLGSS